MTGSGKFAILALLFAGALLCGGEGRVVQFGSINLRVSLEAAPSVVRTAGGGGIYSSGGTVLTNKRWVAIMVSYVPGVASRKTPKTKNDYLCIAVCVILLAVILLVSTFVNGGRYWNPFK